MDPLSTPPATRTELDGGTDSEVRAHVDVDVSPKRETLPSPPAPSVAQTAEAPNSNAPVANGQQHRRRSRPRRRRSSDCDSISIPPTAIAMSPSPPAPVPVLLGLDDLHDLDLNNRTTLERRRQQTLLVSILDLLIGLGLLTYHTDRIITFYRPTRSQLQSQQQRTEQPTDYTSPLVITLWIISFSIILLHLATSASLLSCSYSARCTYLSESSRSTRRANFWTICAQLLMTIWIAKLTVYTASFQFGYQIGVFNIVVEDYTSIWFVLLFYLGLVIFKGVGIFFVRKYVREL